MEHNYKGKILRILPGSIAEELGLKAGDSILAINGESPADIIDVSFAMAEEEIELLVERRNGNREPGAGLFHRAAQRGNLQAVGIPGPGCDPELLGDDLCSLH